LSTLGKMIQLHQFQFNHTLTFFKSLLLMVHVGLVFYVHPISIRKIILITVQLVKLWQFLLKNLFLSWKLI